MPNLALSCRPPERVTAISPQHTTVVSIHRQGAYVGYTRLHQRSSACTPMLKPHRRQVPHQHSMRIPMTHHAVYRLLCSPARHWSVSAFHDRAPTCSEARNPQSRHSRFHMPQIRFLKACVSLRICQENMSTTLPTG